MKQGNKNNRDKRIYIRLTEGEYKILHKGFSKSTMRKLSEYNRNILLNRPITVFSRNKSVDEFIEELVALKGELNAIGNNFNQVVKKLHAMQHNEEIKGWAILNEKSKDLFFKKLDEIETRMTQIVEKWSQE